jgi:disulfide bond formation protein DsbB
MSIEAMERFFALLTIAALAGIVVGVLGRFVRGGVLAQPFGFLRDSRLVLSATVAAVAMGGSLYFSEVGHLTPCLFCWYQRCLMYPLAIILAIAAVRRDRSVRPYAIGLSSLGVLVSGYHYAMEWFHSLDRGVCKLSVPCTFVYFRQFGFMSLAFMALTGFAFILTLFTLPGDSE